MTTVAGLTRTAYGNGGPGSKANLSNPSGLRLDSSGNIYVADKNNAQIRKLNVATGDRRDRATG